MTYSLRDYQGTSATLADHFLTTARPGHGGLLVLPTGSGKSLVIAEVATKLPGPCVVFQPSKEILEQNLEKLLAYGYNPAIYSASMGEKRAGKLTLATIGSVVNQANREDGYRRWQWVKYVLVDEAHLVNPKGGMYEEFLAAVKPRVLGLTATPYRLSTDGYGGSMLKFLTRTRPRVFSEVVHVVQTGELAQRGYFARLEYKEVASGFKAERVRLNSTGADYDEASLRAHFKELAFSDQVVRCVRRFGELGRGPALVFTSFVEEAEYVANRVPGAAVVTAQTPKKERAQLIRDFRAGKIPAVCNVGVLTTGFDFPGLRNVLLARPTLSLGLYYQMVGRGVRPCQGKDCCYVVDMVGLSKQFGRVEDLEVGCGPNGSWYVHSKGRQLTNVYYGERGRAYAVQANLKKKSLAPGAGHGV